MNIPNDPWIWVGGVGVLILLVSIIAEKVIAHRLAVEGQYHPLKALFHNMGPYAVWRVIKVLSIIVIVIAALVVVV